jgi:hypothetical protein
MQSSYSPSPRDVNQPAVQSAAPKSKLLDQVREAICARHYSKRTEEGISPFFIFYLQFVICHRSNY